MMLFSYNLQIYKVFFLNHSSLRCSIFRNCYQPGFHVQRSALRDARLLGKIALQTDLQITCRWYLTSSSTGAGIKALMRTPLSSKMGRTMCWRALPKPDDNTDRIFADVVLLQTPVHERAEIAVHHILHIRMQEMLEVSIPASSFLQLIRGRIHPAYWIPIAAITVIILERAFF